MSDRLESLFTLAARVTAAESEPAVLSAIVDEGADLAGAAASVVGLVEGDVIRVVAARGYPPGYLDQWQTFPLAAGTPMSDVVASGKSVYCGSREERDRRWPVFRGTGNTGSEAFVVLPLAGQRGLLGALTLSYGETREFEREDRLFLEAFSAQCALALERARATAAERVARARTERLQRFTSRLAPALTIESVVEISIDKALVASGGTTAVLGLASEDGMNIEITVGGEHQEELQKHHVVTAEHASVIGDAFRRQEPVWLTERWQWEEYPEAIGRPASLQAVAVVPIQTANRFFGVLAIAFDHEREFPEEERKFLLAIAGQAAQAIDRARLYEEQSHIAHVLQQGLLPQTLPTIPGVEVATSYRAAGRISETGGDFYDVFETADGHVVVIGDVCGKGPVAATLTALCRYTLRAFSLRDDHPRPAELLGLLNSAILAHANGDSEFDSQFATVTCVLLERSPEHAVTATIASGGHPPTLIRRSSGEVDDYQPTGSLVGFRDEQTFTEYTLDLHPGDLMLLHTDGLTDARSESGDRIGDDAVRRTLASLHSVMHPDEAIVAFDRMLSGAEITDDVAVVAVRVSDSPATAGS